MLRLLPALSVACLWGGTAAASLCGPSVVVASGDTMNKIAARCGVTTESIQAANPTVDPYRMAIGQQLTIDADAVLPGLPGNRPPDPDGDGPFLSWLELAPDEADPTLPGASAPPAAVAAATGIVETALPPVGGADGTGGDAAAIAADAVAALGATVDADAVPRPPRVVGDAPAPAAPAAQAPLNPFDPALAAQVPPFPITTDLGTPPRPSVVRSSPPRQTAAAPQRARPQRSQPVIRLTRAQARAALQAIQSGRRSGVIGGLNLADPAARRALRRALGR